MPPDCVSEQGATKRPTRTSRHPDWPLRVLFFGVLLALAATSWVAQALPPRATAAEAAYPPTPSRSEGAGGAMQLNWRNLHHTQRRSEIATVPGVVSGAVTRPRARDGCGFALKSRTARAAVGRCTVLEIGDSLGNDLAWGLSYELSGSSGLTLVRLDKQSTGLAKPSFYDWPQHLAKDVSQYRPDLVLICLGGNDEQEIVDRGTALQFSTTAWRNAYLKRIRHLTSEATSSSAYVLWVGMPIMRPPTYSRGMQILNGLYRQAMLAEPDASFLSSWSLFANAEGAYQDKALVAGRTTALRQGDGIHLSTPGEEVFATYVIGKMASLYHVDLVPEHPAKIARWP